MQTIFKIWKKIEVYNRIIFIIGGIYILLLALITIIDVIARFIFNNPIKGGMEISSLIMATIIFLCLGYSFTAKAHIRLEIIAVMLPTKIQLLLDKITNIMTAIFLIIMMWQGAIRAFRQWSSHTYVLHIPNFPFAFLVCLGSAFGFLSLIGYICFNSSSFNKKNNQEN